MSSKKAKNNNADGNDSDDNMLQNHGFSRLRRLLPSRSKRIRDENRRRLRALLYDFACTHNWRAASGVLAPLFKGSSRGFSMLLDRRHFFIAMEIQKRLGDQRNSHLRIKKLFDLWTSKKAWLNEKKRHFIHLELALFYILQGDIDQAHNITKFLVEGNDSSVEPMISLIHGMVLYQMWYTSLPAEMQIKACDINVSPDMHFATYNDGHLGPESFENSDEHNAINVGVMKFNSLLASETSVGNEKNVPQVCDLEKQKTYDHNHEFHLSESANDRMEFSDFHHQPSNFSIFFTQGLEKSLLPLKLNQLAGDLEHTIISYRRLANEQYHEAVKHLRLALDSKKPLLAALLPLVQLLLLGDLVKEALMEIEKSCHYFDSVALPFRLKARILESLRSSQVAVISVCYEDALKRDPTCYQSLERLIAMHRHGTYSTIPLLELITSHLDAVSGRPIVWEEFASCFLKLLCASVSDYEDRISNKHGASLCIIYSDKLHRYFLDDQARELWKVRCRWWATRHFSKNLYLKELQLGDWNLLAWKAACSSHLYGPEFMYVKAVLDRLKMEQAHDQILSLQRHMENSTRLYENLGVAA